MPLGPGHVQTATAAGSAEAFRLTRTRAYGSGQQLASGAASAATATAIGAAEILVHASAACFIATGAAPVAAPATGIPLNAGEKLHLRIDPTDKVAAIQNGAAAGTVNIVPVV